MVEAELLLMGRLRKQVQHLQALLSYLENRTVVEQEDYAYSHTKLRELVGGLKELERFTARCRGAQQLRAEWFN